MLEIEVAEVRCYDVEELLAFLRQIFRTGLKIDIEQDAESYGVPFIVRLYKDLPDDEGDSEEKDGEESEEPDSAERVGCREGFTIAAAPPTEASMTWVYKTADGDLASFPAGLDQRQYITFTAELKPGCTAYDYGKCGPDESCDVPGCDCD
jgi:hypothetical protein